jgi:hypothetical protein
MVSEIVKEINTRMSNTQKLQELKTRLGTSVTVSPVLEIESDQIGTA